MGRLLCQLLHPAVKVIDGFAAAAAPLDGLWEVWDVSSRKCWVNACRDMDITSVMLFEGAGGDGGRPSVRGAAKAMSACQTSARQTGAALQRVKFKPKRSVLLRSSRSLPLSLWRCLLSHSALACCRARRREAHMAANRVA